MAGAVILKHGQSVRLMQATYRFPDGRPARGAELPLQDPLGLG
jgi:hypothetical protein